MFATETPAHAFLAAEPGLLAGSAARRDWEAKDGPFPAIYLSHGAPPLFDDADWIAALGRWADSLPRPRGIVIVSAHWENAPVALSATAAGTPLVYDFGGFHPYYYSMQYRTPDAGELANRVAAALPDGTQLTRHPSRGLDHGAWVPLKVMYPAGDVPVVQMSIPTHDPVTLMALGSRLRELRHEGVLVIGSGFWTHGLPFLTADNLQGGAVPGWSADFDRWAAELLLAGDVDGLTRYASSAPGMPYAHPTVEHFSPLFVTLGAADDAESGVRMRLDDFTWGLSRRSFELT